MDLADFKQRIKEKKLSGIYIFAGEEEYLVRYYLSQLRAAAGSDPAFAVFNNPVYDGAEIDLGAIEEDIKSPPMMADFKLIEWRHADLTRLKEQGLSALDELCESISDYPYAVLAFTADKEGFDLGTARIPSPFVKRFSGKINILYFEKSTDAALLSWLKKHFDAEGVAVSADTLRALLFRSGHSMDILACEVEKLCVLARARSLPEITEREVMEVASSTPECDTFDFSNAISERNIKKAFVALEKMRNDRVDPTVIFGMMAKKYGEILTVAYLLEEGRSVQDMEGVLKWKPFKIKTLITAAKKYGRERLSEIVSMLSEVNASAKYGGVGGYTAVELFITRNL